MEALEALKTRRSVRQFKDKEVEDEKIREMIDTARLAPSGKNVQPVEYIVVKEEKGRERLADLASHGSFIADAPLCIIACSKKCSHDIEDGSAATENILLAARAQGLASCWVAGYKRDYNKSIKDYLGIPDDYRVISLLAIGYSDKNPEPPAKRELEDVIHFEKF